jgi:hypothetical protein
MLMHVKACRFIYLHMLSSTACLFVDTHIYTYTYTRIYGILYKHRA